MSIERCDKHDRSYDTDMIEECPECASEAGGRHDRAAQLATDWASDISAGSSRGNLCAMDFIERLNVDDEDIANLICDFSERDTQWRLNKALEEAAASFFRDDPKGRQLIEDALDAEDREREDDEAAEREYQRWKARTEPKEAA